MPRIVALEENQENVFDVQTFDTAFVRQYRKLVNGDGSVQCAKKGESLPVGSGRVPDAVILDVSQLLCRRTQNLTLQ